MAARGSILFLVIMWLPVARLARAAEAPADPSARRVFAGIYVNRINELDLKRSTYAADFYVWFRWTGDIDPGNFEFLNGSLDLREHPDSRAVGGQKYVSYHCRGTFQTDFDYRQYPLDEHVLQIEMEDGDHESDRLQYVADTANLKRLHPVLLPGWTCSVPQFSVREHTYETNFGDPTRPQDAAASYSRLYCTIRVSHRAFSIYVKTFLALFISVAIAFLSFLLKPGETDSRFGVGLAAIFGAISSEIVMSGNLPDMPYLTLADKIHLFSLFTIFLTLVQACVALRLFRDGRSALAIRLDRAALVAFPALYLLVVAIMTWWR